MRNKYSNTFGGLVILGLIALLSSCGFGSNNGCKEIPSLFNGKEISADLLNMYMLATSSNKSESGNDNEDVRIYVDKSSGINEAFSSPVGGNASKNLLGEIMNNYRNAKFYSVLKEITPFDLGGADPSNYFVNANNYEKVDGESANLLNALNQISENNGLSFFITDAEQFDATKSEITNGAWAIEPLKKWINQGNSVHFWITDFQVKDKVKKNITKHLFFMAFVQKKASGGKQFQDLVKSLNTINPVHLELSNTSWQLLTPNWAEQSTGLDANLMKEGVFEKEKYFRNFNSGDGSYEYMSISYPIKAEVLTATGALSKPQFYRNLFIDLSNNKFFDISKLSIEVTDITNDINHFAKFIEITSNQPPTTKDSNNQQTILDPSNAYSCFYELKNDKPIIKGEYIYTKNYERKLKEFFQFDEEIFKNSMKDNSSNVELGLRFHKNFNESDNNLNNDFGYNIIRVDFKIADFNDKNVTELSYFTWPSMWKPSETNSGFGKSVEQVIKNTQPKDKIVHTLLIKFIKS
jgi:hypothetical protein